MRKKANEVSVSVGAIVHIELCPCGCGHSLHFLKKFPELHDELPEDWNSKPAWPTTTKKGQLSFQEVQLVFPLLE